MPIIPSVAAALEAISQRFPAVASRSEAAPVFVLSAGWCPGAAALPQMLLRHCRIWKEPYGHACPIPQMAETIKCLTAQWPPPQDSANPFPPVQALLDAHRAWLETLLAEPARHAGSKRWGLSEFRLSIDHARYLKWLFPRARFLFLICDPFTAWRSYTARREQGNNWFWRWPDQPLTVQRFARHWRELASGFAEQAGDIGGLLLNDEDLTAKPTLSRIEEFLGFPLDREAAAIPPAQNPHSLPQLSPPDLHVLHTELGDLATRLGYEYPVQTPHGITTTARFRPNSRSRCVVLVPAATHVMPRCELSLKELERRGYLVRRVYGYAAIDQGRNQMVTDALRAGFEETMWIDSDIGFDPDDVDRLRSHELPLVCGIYPQKGKRALACHMLPGTKQLTFGKEGGLHEILYAPTGFLHVRRHVYETVKSTLAIPTCNERFASTMEPFFQPLIRDDGSGYWYLAEDFAFCHRVRAAGIKVMADTTIRLWHIGNYAYSWEDAGMDQKRYGTFHYQMTDGRPLNDTPPRPTIAEET